MIVSFGLSGSKARADGADPKKLTEQMETLLEAYNKNDVKAFFANWAKAAEAIATEPTYNVLYKMGAKSNVGDYKAKTAKFRKEGSVLEGDVLIVYFEAEFSKHKECMISVNFMKEGGGYKFLQVLMEKKR
jgi:hypothetical protein